MKGQIPKYQTKKTRKDRQTDRRKMECVWIFLLTQLQHSGDVQINPGPTIPHLNAPVALTTDSAPQQVKSDFLAGELQRNQDFMHLNLRSMIADLSVPMLHADDGISHQIKGKCFVGVTQRRFDCIHCIDPGPMRDDLGDLMAHGVGGVPHRLEGECLVSVLRSDLDSLRGECFDMVAQSNQDFIQTLRTDLSNADVLPSEKLLTVPSSQTLNQMSTDVRFKYRVNMAIVKQRQLKLFRTGNHARILWDIDAKSKRLLGGHKAKLKTLTSYESLWTSGAAVAYVLPSLWMVVWTRW